MNQQQRLAVYQAQTKNVKMLKKAQAQMRRSINLALRSSDEVSAEVHTRTFALLFCAWAEANFSKMIHTPHGFTLDEIAQIKRESTITEKWQMAVNLGLRKVMRRGGNFVPNARQRLHRAIADFVENPSLIRNKIAHGQWRVALNNPNTDLNPQTTASLAQLDIVSIEHWFTCHELLANVVEALTESPDRAFPHGYWVFIANFEEKLRQSNLRTLTEHVAILRRKPLRR